MGSAPQIGNDHAPAAVILRCAQVTNLRAWRAIYSYREVMRLDYGVPAVFAALLVVGCAADNTFTDEMPDDLPAGQSDTGEADDGSAPTPTSSSSGAEGESSSVTGDLSDCQSSDDCLGNDVCVAPWDADTQTHGAAECSFACIPSLDDTQWCADAAACCDPDASCTARGYCVPPQEPGGADSSTGADGASDSADESGTSEGEADGSTGGGR